MANPDLRSASDTGDVGRRESTQSASAIASDFAALAAIFDRQLAALSDADAEARAHLVRAKEAAERGAKLSQLLIERMQASK